MTDCSSLIETSIFFRINEEITPVKNLPELYDSIVNITRELTGSEAAYLILRNKIDSRLYYMAVTDSEKKVTAGEPLSGEPCVEWHVFKGRETIVLNYQGDDSLLMNQAGTAAGPDVRDIICTPMTARGDAVGVLEAVNSSGMGYSGRERSIIEIIGMISASAITARMLYDDLKKRMEELNALYDLSNAAVTASDESEFFRKVIEILAASLNVERASLIFYNRKREQLEVAASYGSSIPDGTVIREDSIAAYVFKHGRPMNVQNIMTDLPEILKTRGGYKSDAFVSIPLFYNGTIVGVLNLTDRKNRRQFDEFEMHVLSSIIKHVTGIYRSYSDRRSEEKRRRLREEIRIASEIQRKNLARIPRTSGSISISVLYEPAREVGGDFFDFYEISDNIAAFLIADVSGKGIPAALFTGTVKNILRGEQRVNYDPAALFTESNTHIYSESEYGMFVTAFYIIIDEHGRKLYYSSAGHNDQMLLRRGSGETVPLKTPGKPLGVSDNPCYTGGSEQFENGDILLLFTDGLVEALGGEEMDIDAGFEKLGMIVLESMEQSAEQLLNNIRNAVRDSSRDAELADDLTLLVIQL